MSTQVRFKVTDTRIGFSSVSAISPKVTIAGSITITDLDNYNDPITVGDWFQIKFDKTGGLLEDADITYSRDGGNDGFPYPVTLSPMAITGDTGNTYSWQITTTTPLSPNVKLKVADHDDPTGAFDVSPAFRLQAKWNWDNSSGDGNPGGKVGIVGEDLVFKWKTDGLVDDVRIDYDVHGDDSWEAVPIEAQFSNVSNGTTTYTWTIPDLANILSDTVKIQISDYDDPNSILTSGIFKIRGNIEITSPVANDNWNVADTTKSIKWTYTGPIQNVNVYYSYDGSDYLVNKINTNPVPASQGPTGIPWTIPDHISNNVRVKVVSTIDLTEYGESGQFSIRGVIAIKDHPVSTDEWVVGDTEEITWTEIGTISGVRIQHSPTGLVQDYYDVLGAEDLQDTSGEGSFTWTVPSNIRKTHKIRIISNDDSVTRPSISAVSSSFRIKGRLTIQEPVGNQILPVNLPTDGDSLKSLIQWQVEGAISKIDLQYSYDGGVFNTIPGADYINAETSSGSGVGQFLWLVPNTISDNVIVKVKNRDSGETDVMDDSDNCVIAGRLDLTTPDGGGLIYNVDTSIPILWVTRGSVANVKFMYSMDGGVNYDYDVLNDQGNPAVINASNQSFSWKIPDSVSGNVRVQIMDADPSANTVIDASQSDFEIRGWIEIDEPDAGDVWFISKESFVQWTTHGTIPAVKIEFSVNGAIDPDPIVASISGDTNDYTGTGEPDYKGQASWVLPMDAVGKNNVKVKITSLGDSDVTAESGAFTARGGFEFVDRGGTGDDRPLEGARWAANSTKVIKWTTLGNISTVRVFYAPDASDPNDLESATWWELTNAQTGTNNVGQFQWVVMNTLDPDLDSDTVRVKIQDFNDEDAVGYSEEFTIHDIVYLDRPNGTDDAQDAKILLVGNSEAVKWHTEIKGAGGLSGIVNLKMEYSVDGGNSWVDPSIYASTGNDGQENWTVPDAIGNLIRVRVSDVDDSLVNDVSANNCFIKPKFTVTKPDGTVPWLSNNQMDIKWTTVGNVPTVNIYYSTDNGGSWAPVVHATETMPYANDGTLEWIIPNNVARTAQALVKVESSTDSLAYDESSAFSIKGQFIVDYPTAANVLFRCGTRETIRWTTYGIVQNVGLKYFTDGTWYDILNAGGGTIHTNSGSFEWTVPDIRADDVKIMVYDVGDSLVKGESLNAFSVKPRLVFATTDEPKGGEIYLYGTQQEIRWTTYGPSGQTIDIEYSKDNLQTWETPMLATEIDNEGSFSWVIPDSVSGNCYVRVKDHSEPGVIYVISGKFRIRSIINLMTPNGGVQVRVGDQLDIKWTQSGATSNIYLYYFDDLVDVPIGIDGGTGIITNPAPSGGIRTYVWTVPDAINDNIKVGVADPNDVNATKDESAAVFPITARFTITNPFRDTKGTPSEADDDFSKWDIGSTKTIEWSWTGTVDTMNLYYSLNGVDYNSIIQLTGFADDPDHLASFDWYIDPTIVTTPSPNFYIKIADSLDVAKAYGVSGKAKVRADFTLDGPPKTEFIVGEVYSIGWDTVGYVENVDLHYSTDSGASFPSSKEIVPETPNDGEFSWTIPDDITHTMKVRVKSSIDVDAYDITSQDLRIKGEVWINSPVFDVSWDIGDTYDIKWGWKGTIDNFKITYSIDGISGTFNPIIENSGTPDDGIVAFVGAGSGGVGSEHIYPWTIPDEATNDAIIKVEDARGTESDISAYSGIFHLVCNITVIAPVIGDRWDVASTHDIQWRWGGTMPEVKITYSVDGANGTFNPVVENSGTLNDGIVSYGAGDGNDGQDVRSFAWVVPDDISPNCVVRVTDPRDSTVFDNSDVFKIQGAFTLLTPAVTLNDHETPADPADDFYECRWITNEVRKVTWTTFGTIPNVDLVYSKNDFQTEISMLNGTNVANTGTFNWTIPDDRSDTVKVRIYDHNDHDVYVEGPVGSGGVDTMKIDYYKITWDLRDLLTNAPIEGLTISCTSGWEATGLASPIIHETPAGFWEATWSHKEYGTITEPYLLGWDEDAQEWKGDRTIYRTMETLVVHIWRAYTEFAYDVENDVLDTTSWLERDGSLVSGTLITDLTVFDGQEKIKRLSIVVDETAGANGKHYFYENIPDGTKMWIGDRFGEVRTMQDVISDCAAYKVRESDISADFGGFFTNRWTPTSHTSGGVSHDSLEPGKVYAVVSYMCIATGASFRTPVSFSITAPKQMYDMKETIDAKLDKPLSEVDEAIQLKLDAQTDLIQTTLDEQTQTISETLTTQTETLDTKLTEQTTMIRDTLTSFENSVQGAIEDLAEGAADIRVAGSEMRLAGEEFEETARRYSGRLILPDSLLVGDTLNVRYRVIGAGAVPIMDLYDHDNNLIVGSQILTAVPGVEELYGYDVLIDDSFTGGKAITIMVTEANSGNLEVGSVMIESMSLTAVAGLASSAPRAASLIQEALDAIAQVKTTLSVDVAGTNAALMHLQETVDVLPQVIAAEVEKGKTGAISRRVEEISEQLSALAGEEGYDLSTILEKKLTESPTIKDIRDKADSIKGAVGVMRDIVEQKLGGSDEPVVSTSLVSE